MSCSVFAVQISVKTPLFFGGEEFIVYFCNPLSRKGEFLDSNNVTKKLPFGDGGDN